MIYFIYDHPKDRSLDFINEYSEHEIHVIIPKTKIQGLKNIISCSKEILRKTEAEDTLIFWYDLMGIFTWWLAKLSLKKRNIVVINILLKEKNTFKNKCARFIYRYPIKSQNTSVTVTAKEYGEWLNRYLNLSKKYYILHDLYFESFEYKRMVAEKTNSVFCGGRNGRDWNLFIALAKMMPSITFIMAMPSDLYQTHKDTLPENVNAVHDISEEEFTKLLCSSTLMVMPLDTEAPAGLTVIFQAAANNKMVITTDTMTTREYINADTGCLCGTDINEWKKAIEFYLKNDEIRQKKSFRLKKEISEKCSERAYVMQLDAIIKGVG